MSQQPVADREAERRAREDRATRWAAVAFGVAIVAALALVAVYLTGGDTQAEGTLLFVAFSAVGVGFGIWVKTIIGPEELVEDRYPMRSADPDRSAFGADFQRSLGQAVVGGRRRVLVRLLYGVGASFGLALTVPFLSLGPIFTREARQQLFETDWRPGSRLVTPDGEPILPEEVVADQVLTVFPEGAERPPDSQAVLIGTRDDLLDPAQLPAPDGVVGGIVCYSKICTHAGCPVGLYRASVGELLCPCHQSTFNVLTGAEVVSGPAGRPLPQLPIGVDDEGYLIALSDFVEPVGPSFWNLTWDDPAEDEA